MPSRRRRAGAGDRGARCPRAGQLPGTQQGAHRSSWCRCQAAGGGAGGVVGVAGGGVEMQIDSNSLTGPGCQREERQLPARRKPRAPPKSSKWGTDSSVTCGPRRSPPRPFTKSLNRRPARTSPYESAEPVTGRCWGGKHIGHRVDDIVGAGEEAARISIDVLPSSRMSRLTTTGRSSASASVSTRGEASSTEVTRRQPDAARQPRN